MQWYTASVVLYLKFQKGPQDKYIVWENIYLVRASTHRQALKKAVRLGRAEEDTVPGSTVWGQRPASWVFAGVRQVIACSYCGHRAPGDGTEITFSKMLVRSKKDFKQLVAGATVKVWSATSSSIERVLTRSSRTVDDCEF